MKIFKTKKMILAVVTALVFVGAMIGLHSCNNSDDNTLSLPIKSSIKYLDIDSTERLTIQDTGILQEAQRRLYPFIKTDNGRIELTITSGEKIGISGCLFNFMVKSIEITNDKIKNKELVIFDGKLYKFNSRIGRPLRLKLYETESCGKNYQSIDTYYLWGCSSTVTYNMDGAYEYAHEFQQNNTVLGGITSLVMSFVKIPPYIGAAYVIGTTAISYHQAEALYLAAKSGGITVSSTTFYAPNYITTTVIKDRAGKTILTL